MLHFTYNSITSTITSDTSNICMLYFKYQLHMTIGTSIHKGYGNF